MKRVIVQYTVKPEAVEENEALVLAVYDELRRREPSTLRYATFVLEDGATFVHVAEDEAADGGSTLQQLEAFQRFRANLRERCVIPPASGAVRAIGTYRLFD
jgi:quinol monooxygenase YgiN